MINTNLAMAYAMVGNLDQPTAILSVIERDDKSVDARDNSSDIAPGDKQGALAQWKHILTIDPTHASAVTLEIFEPDLLLKSQPADRP